MNIAELAEMFGVSRPTISAWTNDGMPAVAIGAKGKPWIYESVDCIAWWAENKFRSKRRAPVPGSDPFAEGDGEGRESIEEAERRKMIAQADKAELELAKSARLVVPISEVAAVVAEENSRVRSRLLGIPNEVRMKVRSFFGGDRALEEEIVGGVESTILDAMTEVREPAEMAEARVDSD
jgi:phage terminase Nu1 subunit (DNA packaging protein)